MTFERAAVALVLERLLREMSGCGPADGVIQGTYGWSDVDVHSSREGVIFRLGMGSFPFGAEVEVRDSRYGDKLYSAEYGPFSAAARLRRKARRLRDQKARQVFRARIHDAQVNRTAW